MTTEYAPAQTRAIAYRTKGHSHGPITRLVSPSDVGQLIKPFVFLDRLEAHGNNLPGFGFHPHSGIATLTLSIEGGGEYEESTGDKGTMGQGAVEWMQAGGGVWHAGRPIGERILGYQLWVALPPDLENAPPRSQHMEADSFRTHGPARVILGELGGVRGPIAAPSPMNFLEVRLDAGESWTYDPPPGHDVAWIAVHAGRVTTPDAVEAGELVVFSQQESSITFRASSKAAFVLGSARKHPHELVLGNYSVHTTRDALRLGEAGIVRVAETLRSAGKL